VSVSDAPDWFNAGGANPFSAQAAMLDAFVLTAAAPQTISIPTESSPFHTLGLYCNPSTLAQTPKLTVIGNESNIIYYSGYLAADVVRFGGPVVVPITTLFDTELEFALDVGHLNNFTAWLYLDSVPPVARPYASQLKSVAVTLAGAGTVNLLAADATCTAFILDSVVFAQTAAAVASAVLDDNTGVIYSAYASAAASPFRDDIGGIVVPSTRAIRANGVGVATNNMQVVLRYWRSFSTDGLDVL
jgi:hypothetical protein